MFRKTLALLIRALRVDARSLRPHLIRLGLLATILWLLYLASWQASFMGAPGLQLFSGLTVTNTWFITIVGVTYFASAITEEKEERTLGLLRMADIGGASILLGKWLPRMIGMLSLIVVQFPFTLLAITLGGVTAGQVNAVYVALLLLLVSVGTYSLLFSVICRNTGTAVRLTFIVLLLRWVIPLLAGGLPLRSGRLYSARWDRGPPPCVDLPPDGAGSLTRVHGRPIPHRGRLVVGGKSARSGAGLAAV